MRLIGAVTEGSGDTNEDGMGVLGRKENIAAAWVFDGVTGINDRNYLPGGSDAAWLVHRAHSHLLKLAETDAPIPEILSQLVTALIVDWKIESARFEQPFDYDPPATCLIFVKRYAAGWGALRLGDSILLAQTQSDRFLMFEESSNTGFDSWLSAEAQKRRAQGQFSVGALLAEFRPQLLAARKTRNSAESFGILKADLAAAHNAEYLELGFPKNLLICTDGFYRAVDHYKLHDNQSLLATCGQEGGTENILKNVRVVEQSDPQCQKYIRFKPADDASAIMLAKL